MNRSKLFYGLCKTKESGKTLEIDDQKLKGKTLRQKLWTNEINRK